MGRKYKIGGYLLNDQWEKDPLIIDKASYKCDSNIKNDIIYRMVNNLSSTPYIVNKQLLEYLNNNNNGEKYGILLSKDEINKYEVKENKKTYINKKLKRLKSQFVLLENIIEIADIFKNKNIYFPVKLDKRERLYCVPHYFNYQGTDLAKALIAFANPGIIKRNDSKAIEYLKISGANCYGLDKLSHNKRVQWVNENVENIINYDNGKLIKKAKSKVLFLAFCIEFSRFYNFMCDETLINFNTYLPIQFDGTCNGFQHLAMLSNEKKLFKQLNITNSNKNERPEDWYSYIILRIKEKLKMKLKTITEDSELYESIKRLKNFMWTREIFKKIIMTYPYNTTMLTKIKYIKESDWLILVDTETIKKATENSTSNSKKRGNNKSNKKDDNLKIITWYRTEGCNDLISSKDINLLVEYLEEVINEDCKKISRLITYLKNVAKICNALKVPICWGLPVGLEIVQSYLATDTKKIQIFEFSKKVLNFTVARKDIINKKKDIIDNYDEESESIYDKPKQMRALMPNLIHSLDATSMFLLYDEFTKNYGDIVNLYTIHDCFSTTADKGDKLLVLIRSIYTKLYIENNYLRTFDEGIINIIRNNLGKDNVKWFEEERKFIFIISKKKYVIYLHSLEWVLGNQYYDKKELAKIDGQYIINL